MWILVVGLIVFLGIHSVRMIAPAKREQFIEAKGENAWKGIYTLVSFAGLALMIWGYGQARLDNVFFYSAPTWGAHLQLLLMIPAMILLVATNLPAGHIKKAVKNPTLIAVKIWAIGHMLVNGDLASYLLFGGFLVWAILLVINTKKRGQIFPDETAVKSDIISIVAGIVLWAAITFWLHEWLIGIPAIA